MSKFRRSGHYRQNQHGTTFWVSSHDVSRDEWSRDTHPNHVSNVKLSYKGSTYGITYPNARCPVCKAQVFFFAAYNGGRVFFEPPLGPPWTKHPCTIAENVTIAPLPATDTPSAPQQPDSMEYEVYPQLNGSILVLELDGEEKAYSTPYRFEVAHFPRCWPVRNERGKVTGLSLLTCEFEPVEIPVRGRKLPGPMTQASRRKLASGGLRDVQAITSRITSLPLISSEDVLPNGSHILWAGDTALALVPVPVDHKGAFDEDERRHVREFMYECASEALSVIESRQPAKTSKIAPKPIVLFCFEDCVEALSSSSGSDLGLESDGDIDTEESWRHPRPWLSDLHARTAWIDTLSPDEIHLPDPRITIEEAFGIEAQFCSPYWPTDDAGRWRKIQQMTGMLGLNRAFEKTVKNLRGQNWLLASQDEYGSPLTHELAFARKGNETTSGVRMLLAMSSAETFTFVAGWADESQPVEDYLHYIETPEQLFAMLKNLAQKRKR